MGRLDVNTIVTVEADDDLLDKLEDIDSPFVDIDAQPGDVHPGVIAKAPANKSTRRRLEDRLEDLRLQRQITDYSFSLH